MATNTISSSPNTLAFEYAICKLIEWYSDLKGVQKSESLVKFNEDNNFTKNKLYMMPFFLLMSANGSIDMLHKAWGKIEAKQDGPIAIELENQSLRFFEFDELRFKVKDGSKTIDGLTGTVKSELETLGEQGKQLVEAVDNAVRRHKEHLFSNDLPILPERGVKILVSRFISYSIHFNKLEEKIIPTANMKKDRGYSYLSNMRQYVF